MFFKDTAKEPIIFLLAMNTTDNGKTVSSKDVAHSNTHLVQSMKVNGIWIRRMGVAS